MYAKGLYESFAANPHRHVIQPGLPTCHSKAVILRQLAKPLYQHRLAQYVVDPYFGFSAEVARFKMQISYISGRRRKDS